MCIAPQEFLGGKISFVAAVVRSLERSWAAQLFVLRSVRKGIARGRVISDMGWVLVLVQREDFNTGWKSKCEIVSYFELSPK